MGGYIKVVIRFSDGTVHADTYGTNALPFWVCHPKTIMGDESTMRRYIESCTKWNNGDRTYTPVEYGVFVVDFQTKTMLSANDYSHCDSFTLDRVMGIAQRFGAEKPNGEDENGYTIFDEMLYRGFVHVTKQEVPSLEDYADGKVQPAERIAIPGIRAPDWDEKVFDVYRKIQRDAEERRYANLPDALEPGFVFALMNAPREPWYRYEVAFDFPGWTRHCETNRGIEAQDRLRARLRELDFPFDATNEAAYAVWKGRERGEIEDKSDDA